MLCAVWSADQIYILQSGMGKRGNSHSELVDEEQQATGSFNTVVGTSEHVICHKGKQLCFAVLSEGKPFALCITDTIAAVLYSVLAFLPYGRRPLDFCKHGMHNPCAQ